MRSLTHVAAILVLVTASPVGAAPPEVPADLSVKAGKLKEVVIKPDGEKGYGFRLVGAPAAFRKMHSDDPKEHVFWLIPETDGPISIVWWTVGERASTVTEVNRGAKPDPPPPDPKPKPDPKPDPKPEPVAAQKLFVVIVEETADAVAARGALLASPALAARMKDKGHRWRVVDKDVAGPDGQPPADVKRFLDAASGKPYPTVFLVGEDGKAVHTGPLPKDAAGLIDLLAKNGG